MLDWLKKEKKLPEEMEYLRELTHKLLTPLVGKTIKIIDEKAFQLELHKDDSDSDVEEKEQEELQLLVKHLPRSQKLLEESFKSGIDLAFQKLLQRSSDKTKIGKGRLSRKNKNTSSLSLMDDDELSLQIAVEKMSKRINEECQLELAHLCLRIEKVMNRHIEGKESPVGAVAIGNAIVKSLTSVEDIKSVLTRFVFYFEIALSEVLLEFYKEANSYFIKNKILPDLDEDDVSERFFEEDDEVKKQAEEKRKNLLSEVTGDSEKVIGDQFLKKLGSLFGSKTDDEVVAEHQVKNIDGAEVLSKDEILGFIDNINQQTELNSFTEKGSGYVDFDAGNLSQYVQKTLATEGAGLDEAAQGALSALSMMFSEILSKDSVAEPIKNLISHMQVPVLKAAVMDEEFFADADNPAQNLIDDLVAATASWSPQEDEKRDPLYQKAASVVDYVGKNFEDDYSVFENASHEIKSFVEGEQRKARIFEKRMLEKENAKARVDSARAASKTVLNSKTEGIDLPDEAKTLLFDNWDKVLFLIYNKKGPDSLEWQDALIVIDNVVKALKADSTLDHEKFYSDLSKGLLDSGIDPFKVDVLLNQFQAMLADKDKPSELEVDNDITLPESLASDEQALSDLYSDINNAQSLNDETLDIDLDLDDLESQQPSDELVFSDAIAKLTNVDDAPEAEANKLPDEHDALVKELTAGAWLQFLEFGTVKKLRLAAIIQHTGIYVFVDRSGIKKAEYTAEQLADLFRDNSVNMLESNILFEQALESVIGRLRAQ